VLIAPATGVRNCTIRFLSALKVLATRLLAVRKMRYKRVRVTTEWARSLGAGDAINPSSHGGTNASVRLAALVNAAPASTGAVPASCAARQSPRTGGSTPASAQESADSAPSGSWRSGGTSSRFGTSSRMTCASSTRPGGGRGGPTRLATRGLRSPIAYAMSNNEFKPSSTDVTIESATSAERAFLCAWGRGTARRGAAWRPIARGTPATSRLPALSSPRAEWTARDEYDGVVLDEECLLALEVACQVAEVTPQELLLTLYDFRRFFIAGVALREIEPNFPLPAA